MNISLTRIQTLKIILLYLIDEINDEWLAKNSEWKSFFALLPRKINGRIYFFCKLRKARALIDHRRCYVYQVR